MVLGTNSVLTGIHPQFGHGEEGNFIQYEQRKSWYSRAVRTTWPWNSLLVLHLNYEAARLWNSMAVRWSWGKAALGWGPSPATQLCLALPRPPLFHLLCSTQVQWDVFSVSFFDVSAPVGKMPSSVFSGKGKCTPQARGSPCLWSLIGPSSCK